MSFHIFSDIHLHNFKAIYITPEKGSLRLMYESVVSSIKKNSYNISAWFERHQKRIPSPFLSSVVIKDSGFKLSLSHTNAFPIGLNHLSKSDLNKAPNLIKKYFKQYHPSVERIKKVLVLVSTKNLNPFYYEHIATLTQILKKSSLKFELGTLEPLDKPFKMKTPSQKTVTIYTALIENNMLKLGDFIPDFILVMDPFSLELSAKLAQISQPMSPPQRILTKFMKKSDYLHAANTLTQDFAQMIGIDPWLFSTQFHVESRVNIEERHGIEKVASVTQDILQSVGQKYDQYHVQSSPSVLISNNTGSFGMGMLSIKSTKELSELYYKKKTKKSATKSQSVMNDVLVEEAVPTRPLFKKYDGETVIYLIGGEILGGYIKTYSEKITNNMISTRNALFQPLSLNGGTTFKIQKQSDRTLGLVYQNLSRIGGLTIGYETD